MKDVQSFSLVGLFVLLTGIAPGQAGAEKTATERPGPPCAATDYSVVSGLVVDIVPKKDGSLDLRSVKNPCISGVALQIH